MIDFPPTTYDHRYASEADLLRRLEEARDQRDQGIAAAQAELRREVEANRLLQDKVSEQEATIGSLRTAVETMLLSSINGDPWSSAEATTAARSIGASVVVLSDGSRVVAWNGALP